MKSCCGDITTNFGAAAGICGDGSCVDGIAKFGSATAVSDDVAELGGAANAATKGNIACSGISCEVLDASSCTVKAVIEGEVIVSCS